MQQEQITMLTNVNAALKDQNIKQGEELVEQQKEIDRLRNIINTAGIQPNPEQIENLQREIREWRHLALNLSNKIHNGHTLYL